MQRSIVLHLLAGLEVIPAGGHNGRLPDALSAAECRQSLIRECRAAEPQFLMDSHEIPLAGVQQFEDLLPVSLGLLRPLDLRHAG